MTAPAYFAMGGVIFVREHVPITLEKAEAIRAIHLHNVAHWLEREDLPPSRRTAIAKIEQDMADQIAGAIRQITGQAANDAAAAETTGAAA